MTNENRSVHEYLRNPNVDERYVSVLNHEGANICTLAEATPSNGDELGYVIDHVHFEGKLFSTIGAATESLERESDGHRWDSEPKEISEEGKDILNLLASGKLRVLPNKNKQQNE